MPPVSPPTPRLSSADQLPGQPRAIPRLVVSGISVLLILLGTATEEAAISALGFLALGLFGISEIVDLARDWPQRWSVSELYAPVILTWYGIGAAVGLAFANPQDIGMVTADDQDHLALAGLFLIASTACLWLVAPWERRFWTPLLTAMSASRQPITPGVIIFLAVLSLLLINMLLDGQITFRGFGDASAVQEQAVRLPVLPSLVAQISTALIGYFGWVLGNRRLPQRRLVILIALVMLPLTALIVIGEGRRALLVQSIVFFSLYFVGRGQRMSWGPLLRVAVILLPALFIAAMLFQSQRATLSAEGHQAVETQTLFDSVGDAATALADNIDDAIEWQAENLPYRMFLIGYIKDLIGAQSPGWGLGNGIVAEVVQATPSFLLDNKRDLILELGGTGSSRNTHFDLPLIDSPNSLLSLAYMEFSWGGVLFVGLTVALSGAFTAWLLVLGGNDLFRWLGFSMVLAMHLTVETTYLTTITGMWRLLLVMLPLSMLLAVTPTPPSLNAQAQRDA